MEKNEKETRRGRGKKFNHSFLASFLKRHEKPNCPKKKKKECDSFVTIMELGINLAMTSQSGYLVTHSSRQKCTGIQGGTQIQGKQTLWGGAHTTASYIRLFLDPCGLLPLPKLLSAFSASHAFFLIKGMRPITCRAMETLKC